MNERQAVARYLMDPAEDVILFGDELAEGMWVLPESPEARPGSEAPEDERLRGQRFCRVTRLRRKHGGYQGGEGTVFVGEWVDGYQRVISATTQLAWIVKKSSLPGAETETEPTP